MLLFIGVGKISPSAPIDYVSCKKLSDAQITLLTTLQGLAARAQQPFFLEIGSYEIWLKNLLANDLKFKQSSFEETLDHYMKYANGYVLCDSDNIVVGIAASIPHQAVVVTGETEQFVQARGLKCKLDVRGKDEAWLWEYVNRHLVHYNRNGIVQPTGKKPYSMADYAISNKLIVINEKGKPEQTKRFYSLIEPNSPRLGWASPYGDEKRDVGLAAEYGLYTLPTGNTMNLSFFESVKNWKSTVLQKRIVKTPKTDAKKHYAMILISDGDNINWHYSGLVAKGKYKDHPAANKYPISWMYPPRLKDISPVVHDYYMRSLPASHAFVGGVSGVGYTFPSKHKNIGEFSTLTNQYMKACGMDYLVIMDFLDFRKEQKVLLTDMMQKMPDVKGLYYMDYGNYAKWNGDIYFIGDKPVISLKYRLWIPMDPLEKIAEAINKAPRNPYSKDGYSAVVVHAWSYDIGEVERFIKMLNSDVELVNAEQLMQLVKDNIKN